MHRFELSSHCCSLCLLLKIHNSDLVLQKGANAGDSAVIGFLISVNCMKDVSALVPINSVICAQ